MFAPVAALAQEDPPPPPSPVNDPRAEASARFKRGTELFKEQSYDAALAEFRRSHELTDEYRVLYNIAQVCYQLREYVCALHSFESYLTRGADEITPERRTEVEAEIGRLRPRIGTLLIVTNVAGAEVTVDNVSRGATPLPKPVQVSAGKHTVQVAATGKLPVTRMVEVAGAEEQTLWLDLVDATTVVVREKEAPVVVPSRWTTLSFVGLAAGGALAVGAGVTGLLALDASSDLSKIRYVGDPSDEATKLRSRVTTLRTLSDVLSVSALLTLGTTLVLTLTRDPAPKAKAASRVDVRIGPREASIVGEF